jgi:hypothetical protein
MAKYSVYYVASLEVEVDAEAPLDAATLARDQILGMLNQLPPGLVSVGFMPQHGWQVRTVLPPVPTGNRPGPIVLRGKDNDLNPRHIL